MNKTIVVIGATGAQGKGVVNALVNEGTFQVKAVTRNPEQYSGDANEAVFADLNDLESLKTAFAGAYGVFVVTNFWEGADELAQGENAVNAAKAAGVEHFIWSTLPNVEVISDGAFDVPHFTNKAKVDNLINEAGFKYVTFVQPPFYYQNLVGAIAPQPMQDGTTGWTLPIDPTKKAIHMADINDLGKVVAGAFLHPELAGNGEYVALSTGLYSFNDVIEAFSANGKTVGFTHVPREVFAGFFEGAKEYAEMFGYFETHTYMGPDAAPRIQRAEEIATGDFASLKDWVKTNA